MTSPLPLPIVPRDPNPAQSSNSWSNRLKWLLGLCVALAIFVAVIVWIVQRSAPSAANQAQAASQSPSNLEPHESTHVFALGSIEPRGRVISVASPSGSGEARIESLRVAEGDQVKQGEILAVLDNELRLKAAVQVAHDRALQSKMQIEQTDLEIETTRAQLTASVEAARARLAQAESTFQRTQALRASQTASQESLDVAQAAFLIAQQNLNEVQAKLQRYEVTDSNELIDLQLARQAWITSTASLEQAEADLETAYLRAPVDGTILRLNLQVGERIGQASLLEMGAVQSMMALVEVYETEVRKLRFGQTVILTSPSLDRSLTGVVESIAQLVRRQELVESTPAAMTDARVVEVWVAIDPDSTALASRFIQLQVRAEFIP